MLKYKETESKEVKIIDLVEGQIFKVNGKLFSFIRIKRGGVNMLATNLENEKNYNIRIRDIFDTKTVIGTLIKKETKDTVKDNSITIPDVKLNETVVIMTGRGNSIPQLYTLVEIKPKNVYSHVFKNPVTDKREQFRGKDNWKVFRLNDLIK